jgi:hypothetical protein
MWAIAFQKNKCFEKQVVPNPDRPFFSQYSLTTPVCDTPANQTVDFMQYIDVQVFD